MNEGFGAFFEYSLIENVFPTFRAMHLLNIQKLQNGFQIDNEAAHAMTFAGDYIYGIYYDKSELRKIQRRSIKFKFFFPFKSAVSVIRMFQHAVGETIFREALKAYLDAK